MQDLIKEYQVSAKEIETRINDLKIKAQCARGKDALLLEKRIEILKIEYWELQEAIGEMSLEK